MLALLGTAADRAVAAMLGRPRTLTGVIPTGLINTRIVHAD